MWVVISQFTVANGMAPQVQAAFLARPHAVDSTPGFIGMEVMHPQDNPQEVWLLTRWADESSYQSWHRSPAYRDAHQGIPKGLKLVPGKTRIQSFQVFAT